MLCSENCVKLAALCQLSITIIPEIIELIKSKSLFCLREGEREREDKYI